MKKLLYLAFIPAVVLTACSKEKRMERMIYKSGGEWNITTMEYTLVSTDMNGVDVTVSATAEDAGTFTFEEGGDGEYNFTLDGTTYSQNFGWTSSEESFSISKISQVIDFFNGDITQIIIAGGGDKSDKNKLTLSGTQTMQYTMDSGFSQDVLTFNMTLEKK